MSTLEIKNLHVEVNGTEIIHGISLTFNQGSVYALMGPNGSGKSTLAHAIMGHPNYKITKGQILLDGKDVTHEKANVRAKAGLFLSFQYPAEISGVTISNFLRTAVNNIKDKKYNIIDFHNLLKEKMNELHMDISFNKRYLNEGFSGGEKKRAEILQMMLLEPKFAILDETDSGLDVDAIKIVADGINKARKKGMGVIVITHYNKFLSYLQPDEVNVMYKGKIVGNGKFNLAKEIEERGFDEIIKKQESKAEHVSQKGSVTKEELIEIFKSYEDPELHIDVWTLGLIYNIDINGDTVKIDLTFTSPMCPFGPQMVDELTRRIKEKGVKNVEINVVFEPAWKPSDELREMLGI